MAGDEVVLRDEVFSVEFCSVMKFLTCKTSDSDKKTLGLFHLVRDLEQCFHFFGFAVFFNV